MIRFPSSIQKSIDDKNFKNLRFLLFLYRNKKQSDGSYAPEQDGEDITSDVVSFGKLTWSFSGSDQSIIDANNFTLKLKNKDGKYFEGKSKSIYDGEEYLFFGSKVILQIKEIISGEVATIFTGFIGGDFNYDLDKAICEIKINTQWQRLEGLDAADYGVEHEPVQLSLSPDDDNQRTYVTSDFWIQKIHEVRIGQTWETALPVDEGADYDVSGLGQSDEAASVEFSYIPSGTVWARYNICPSNISISDAFLAMLGLSGLPLSSKIFTPHWSKGLEGVHSFLPPAGSYGVGLNLSEPRIEFNSFGNQQADGSMRLLRNQSFSKKSVLNGVVHFGGTINDGYMSGARQRPYETHTFAINFYDEDGTILSVMVWSDVEDGTLQCGGQMVQHVDATTSSITYNMDLYLDIPNLRWRWGSGDWKTLSRAPKNVAIGTPNGYGSKGAGNLYIPVISVNGVTLTAHQMINGYVQTPVFNTRTNSITSPLSAPSESNVVWEVWGGQSEGQKTYVSDLVDGSYFASDLPPEIELRARAEQTGKVVRLQTNTQATDIFIPRLNLAGVSVAEFFADVAALFFYEVGFDGSGDFFFRPSENEDKTVKDFFDDKILSLKKIDMGYTDFYNRLHLSLGENSQFFSAQDQTLFKKFGIKQTERDLPDWIPQSAWGVCRRLGKIILRSVSQFIKKIKITGAADFSVELSDFLKIKHYSPSADKKLTDWENDQLSFGFWEAVKVDSLSFDLEKWEMSVDASIKKIYLPDNTGEEFVYNFARRF